MISASDPRWGPTILALAGASLLAGGITCLVVATFAGRSLGYAALAALMIASSFIFILASAFYSTVSGTVWTWWGRLRFGVRAKNERYPALSKPVEETLAPALRAMSGGERSLEVVPGDSGHPSNAQGERSERVD